MKRTFLLLALGALLAGPALAQSQDGSAPASNPPHQGPGGGGPPGGPGGGFGGGHMGMLTPEERQELMAARQKAMADNPDLAAQMKALQDKINQAMIKADPKVAPIIAKMEAARQQHGDGGPGGPGGGPGASPSDPAHPPKWKNSSGN